jgi:hypothetical protein
MTRYIICQIEMYYTCRNYDTNITETSDEWVVVSKCGLLTSVQEMKCQMYSVVDGNE